MLMLARRVRNRIHYSQQSSSPISMGETAPVESAQYVARDSSEEEIVTLQAPQPDNNKNNARMSLLLNGFPTTLLVDSGSQRQRAPFTCIPESQTTGFQAGAYVHMYLPIRQQPTSRLKSKYI